MWQDVWVDVDLCVSVVRFGLVGSVLLFSASMTWVCALFVVRIAIMCYDIECVVTVGVGWPG